ncbi:TIGR00701 family protein [Lewinellaceae bacterium SD302]|nr:TIGR00701 family protein [Lewinellaceae bacterium SD302]
MSLIYFAKALHIVGFVSWFAGLFFLGRLLVNHAETDERPENERKILADEYSGMETRVYKIITNPAMMITWTGGLLMLIIGLWNGINYFQLGTPGWIHLKLLLVVGLVVYQVYTKSRIMQPMQQGARPLDGWQLRLWNEVPTFFLVSVCFIAVYGKAGSLNYLYLAIGVGLFCLMVYRGARAYAKRRKIDSSDQ